MARIRSVHPGLFDDEKFVDLSTDAQIFLVGLYTQADDQGIFPWKLSTLRMRLRPTKDGSIEAILAELAEHNFITSYEIDGRQYGAVRNFRIFQRPKKPNSLYPITDEIRTYVGLSKPSKEPATAKTPPSSEPVPHQYGNSSAEGGGRREDVGGRMKGEEVDARLNSETGKVLAAIEPILNAPWPITGKDIRPWLKDGATADLVVETVRTVTERQRIADPNWTPRGLKYFDGAVREDMAKAASLQPASSTAEGRRQLLETYAQIIKSGRRTQTITDADLVELRQSDLITEAELKQARAA